MALIGLPLSSPDSRAPGGGRGPRPPLATCLSTPEAPRAPFHPLPQARERLCPGGLCHDPLPLQLPPAQPVPSCCSGQRPHRYPLLPPHTCSLSRCGLSGLSTPRGAVFPPRIQLGSARSETPAPKSPLPVGSLTARRPRTFAFLTFTAPERKPGEAGSSGSAGLLVARSARNGIFSLCIDALDFQGQGPSPSRRSSVSASVNGRRDKHLRGSRGG